jgi:hypothetical protein
MTAAGDPLIALRIEANILFVIWVGLFAVKLFSLCDAVIRKDAFYVAGDKQNKAFWLLLLVVFLALHILLRDPRHILNLIGTVAAFVYLADVRPTLRSMHSR